MTIEMPGTFHVRPEGSGFMLGTSDQHEPYSFNTAVNWEWLNTVVEDAVKRVPLFEQARIHHGWAGLYETSPDYNAILAPTRAPHPLPVIADHPPDGRARTLRCDHWQSPGLPTWTLRARQTGFPTSPCLISPPERS